MRNLFIVVIIVCISAGKLFSQAPPQPYIFLLVMDDMNTYLEGYPTFPQAQTPNLYTLEQSGTVFTNAETPAPKCAPARTSIVTGKDVKYTQVYDNTTYACNHFRNNFKPLYGNEEIFTLPEYLKNTGDYYTYTIGKIFHCYEAYSDYDSVTADPCKKKYSWNQAFVYVEDDIIDPIGDATTEGISNLKWARLNDTLMDYMEDEVSVDAAISFLQDFSTYGTDITCGHPFFMGLGIKKPHAPFYVPESFFSEDYVTDIYDAPFDKPYNDPYNAFPYNGLVMPPMTNPKFLDFDSLGYMGQLFASDNEENQFESYAQGLATLPEIDPALDDSMRIEIINETERANAIMAYLAGVSFLDYQIGRFWTELQSHPEIFNNSIVIITSDHGFSFGTKRHWNKFSMWETDMQVPFIYIDNRAPVHQVCTRSVSTLDIFPTIIDLLDLPEPLFDDGTTYLDGHSLVPLINNPALKWEKLSLGSVRTKNPDGILNDGSCFTQNSLRNNRFHYIKYATNNTPPLLTCDTAASQLEEELYDIGENRETDPNEWNNVAHDPDYAPVLDYMHQFLPDSALYLQKVFTADISATGTIPCFLKNNSKFKLNATLYNAEGDLSPTADYTFKWTNNLTNAVHFGKSYIFNMTTVPAATYLSTDRIFFYIEVTETATGKLVAFNTKTFYINAANKPEGDFNLLTDVIALTATVTDYSLTGSYTNTYWDFGDMSTSEEYIPDTHYYAAPGTYTVKNYIQFGNGCLRSISRTANLTREGAMPMEARLFPNPARDLVTISLSTEISDTQIKVMNMLGEVVYTSSTEGTERVFQLPIAGLPPGTYMVSLQSKEGYYYEQFEVMR